MTNCFTQGFLATTAASATTTTAMAITTTAISTPSFSYVGCLFFTNRTIGFGFAATAGPDLDSLSVTNSTFGLDKGLGSPLGWKSPWSLDPSFSVQKTGTDTILEEIGILINPEDGTDDALGLIKHLSEHAASAYLEAEEILAMEPAKEPLSITVPTSPTFKERAREDESSCKENMFSLDNNFGGDTLSPFSSYLSPFPADFSLPDFKVFSTPGRSGGINSGAEMNQTFVGTTNDFSSPSLYLRKEFR